MNMFLLLFLYGKVKSLVLRSDPNINFQKSSAETNGEVGTLNLDDEGILFFMKVMSVTELGVPPDMSEESLAGKFSFIAKVESVGEGSKNKE